MAKPKAEAPKTNPTLPVYAPYFDPTDSRLPPMITRAASILSQYAEGEKPRDCRALSLLQGYLLRAIADKNDRALNMVRESLNIDKTDLKEITSRTMNISRSISRASELPKDELGNLEKFCLSLAENVRVYQQGDDDIGD